MGMHDELYCEATDNSVPRPSGRQVRDWHLLTLDELGFVEFEHRVFGYGNGSGEPHVLQALKRFCEVAPLYSSYDYELIEQALAAPVACLLINTLRHADMIECGTPIRSSIRFTGKGVALAEFVRARSVENLAGLIYDSAKESSGAGWSRENGNL